MLVKDLVGETAVHFSKIEVLIEELRLSANIDKVKDLEYEIYYLRKAVEDMKEIYLKNKADRALEEIETYARVRDTQKTEAATERLIKEYYKDEDYAIKCQGITIEKLDSKIQAILRLANFYKEARIEDALMMKRNDLNH